ncbi:MAG: amylo-alpha-1,6-glucosidase [Verrucomicrobiota bacterium]
MNPSLDSHTSHLSHEWLETDGLGGFASGTATGIRTRRYHALLLTATTPPTGRLVLVNGFDAWIETPAGRFELTSQQYAPDIIGGTGAQHIEQFTSRPWPRWVFKFEDGTRIEQEILVARESQLTQVCWRLLGQRKSVRLFVRPFLSGRDYHSMHKANGAFRFDAAVDSERVGWNPYSGVPAVVALSNGHYQHEPHWYRNFCYAEEAARGLDDTEDLAAPGVFNFDLASGEAVLMFTTPDSPALSRKRDLSAIKFAAAVRANEELRRAEFPSRLHRAADDYIVNGRHGKTIMAGYPWFTDWGRDTFIALRGLCLATGRLEDARDILIAWANSVSEGMLPNLFPDYGAKPEYNSVDASLWYVIAVHDLLQAVNGSAVVSAKDKCAFQDAILAILDGYSKGTRFGIRMEDDGLLSAGERGVQLTWMDAKVGEWVVTPRAGKTVEVQALWLNALKIASQFGPKWEAVFERGLKSFRDKFWNNDAGYLYDVIDVNHRAGEVDAAFRPNQIFAVGGLPFPLLDGAQAERIVSLVEEKLLTPLGLRSLALGEAGYAAHYSGGVLQRDGAYHQGTVWPWLIGPFVEAWVRVRGNSNEAKHAAREKFLTPILVHLDAAGLGHISEIADATAPHTPRGCPFQAWSVGEALRLDQVVLKERNQVVRHNPTPDSRKAIATGHRPELIAA